MFFCHQSKYSTLTQKWSEDPPAAGPPSGRDAPGSAGGVPSTGLGGGNGDTSSLANTMGWTVAADAVGVVGAAEETHEPVSKIGLPAGGDDGWAGSPGYEAGVWPAAKPAPASKAVRQPRNPFLMGPPVFEPLVSCG